VKWILGALAALVLFGVYAYNRLVRCKADVENGWSQIDVQLKRRHDLIPNLVETVRGYMTHERELFERVAALRAQALGAGSLSEVQQKETELAGALRTLFAVSEGYPELKANANFLALQEELSSTENKIAFARQFYNDAVRAYNVAVAEFPGNLVAGAFGYAKRDFWIVEDQAERASVRVNL
jgi:LemA protein